MAQVEIRVYRQGPHSPERELVETVISAVESEKRLTAGRARRILDRTLPVFARSFGTIMTRTDEGWESSRTVELSEKCSYHYNWEYAVVVDPTAL
ncbi:MAG: hypothetical protein AAGI08_03970 [Bacteroidota bacterium]